MYKARLLTGPYTLVGLQEYITLKTDYPDL